MVINVQLCKPDPVTTNFISTAKEISVKEVSTEAEYDDFIDIIAEVFQFTPSIKLDYTAMCQLYGKNGHFNHYLGFYDHKPISTLTTYTNNGIVGFYNGATLPNMQKHGICTTLAQYAIQHAQSTDNKIGISQLMASGMAKGISEKMGFKTSCILQPFVNHLKE